MTWPARVIGREGTLPWKQRADLRRFRELTLDNPILMGRKTWDSLPKRPLPRRTNIVLSGNPSFHPDGAVLVRSLDQAFRDWPNLIVVGGAGVIASSMARVDRWYLTLLDATINGDTIFAPFELDAPRFGAARFEIESQSDWHPADDENQYPYRYIDYRRRS